MYYRFFKDMDLKHKRRFLCCCTASELEMYVDDHDASGVQKETHGLSTHMSCDIVRPLGLSRSSEMPGVEQDWWQNNPFGCEISLGIKSPWG